MTILVSGGGTGGHITPIRSVAHDIKRHRSDATIEYVGERNGSFSSLINETAAIDTIHTVFSGKFRRYHGETLLQKLTDVRTIALNLRDIVYVGIGIIQSVILLRRIRPDAVFLKGGYVGVPIGLAAALLKVPIITHDSDAMAGLANRVVSKWATLHATALPAALYPYPAEKTLQTGVIVGDEYQYVDAEARHAFRREIDIPKKANVLFVTGGSSGASAINTAVATCAPKLLESDHNLHIIHQTGKGKSSAYGNYTHERLHIHEFVDGLHRYSGAADIVVSRASANTLAELGVQAKPTIVIASPDLAGGHQLKNATYLADKNAVVALAQKDIVSEPQKLCETITGLFASRARQRELADNIHQTSRTDASNVLAQRIIDIATQRGATT